MKRTSLMVLIVLAGFRHLQASPAAGDSLLPVRANRVLVSLTVPMVSGVARCPRMARSPRAMRFQGVISPASHNSPGPYSLYPGIEKMG